jgi:hypothetical protein
MAEAEEEEEEDEEAAAARHPRGWSPQLRSQGQGQQQQQQQRRYQHEHLEQHQRVQRPKAVMQQALRLLHWGATGLRSTIVLTAEGGLPPGHVLAGGGPAALGALRASLLRSRSGSLEAVSPFQQQQQQQQRRQSQQEQQQSLQQQNSRVMWDESRRTPRQATVRPRAAGRGKVGRA